MTLLVDVFDRAESVSLLTRPSPRPHDPEHPNGPWNRRPPGTTAGSHPQQDQK